MCDVYVDLEQGLEQVGNIRYLYDGGFPKYAILGHEFPTIHLPKELDIWAIVKFLEMFFVSLWIRTNQCAISSVGMTLSRIWLMVSTIPKVRFIYSRLTNGITWCSLLWGIMFLSSSIVRDGLVIHSNKHQVRQYCERRCQVATLQKPMLECECASILLVLVVDMEPWQMLVLRNILIVLYRSTFVVHVLECHLESPILVFHDVRLYRNIVVNVLLLAHNW